MIGLFHIGDKVVTGNCVTMFGHIQPLLFPLFNVFIYL